MNVKQNLFVAFALLMLLPLTAGAKPRAKADMKKTAARAINLQTTLNSNKQMLLQAAQPEMQDSYAS